MKGTVYNLHPLKLDVAILMRTVYNLHPPKLAVAITKGTVYNHHNLKLAVAIMKETRDNMQHAANHAHMTDGKLNNITITKCH